MPDIPHPADPFSDADLADAMRSALSVLMHRLPPEFYLEPGDTDDPPEVFSEDRSSEKKRTQPRQSGPAELAALNAGLAARFRLILQCLEQLEANAGTEDLRINLEQVRKHIFECLDIAYRFIDILKTITPAYVLPGK